MKTNGDTFSLYNSKICRLCAKTSTNLFELFTNDNEENFVYKINTYLPLSITDDGKNPRWLCSACCLQLKIAENFNKTILTGQIKLKNLLLEESECILNVENNLIKSRKNHVSEDNDIFNHFIVEEDIQNLEIEFDRNNDTGRQKLLTRLVRLVETGSDLDINKPITQFVCEICYTKTNLFLQHRSTHSSISYECSQCFKIFNTPIDFNHQQLSNDISKLRIENEFNDSDYEIDHFSNSNELNLTRSDEISENVKVLHEHYDNDYDGKYLKKFYKAKRNMARSDYLHTIKECLGDSIGTEQNQELVENCNTPNISCNTNLVSQFRCTSCPKTLESKRKINLHGRNHLSKQFICKECGAGCKSKQELNSHQSNYHENKYSCKLCDGQFSSKQRLKSHIMTHNGVKPHQCEICQKNFTQRFNLVEHMRVHTGERPFQCDKCIAKFKTSSQLRCHKLRHSRMKYQCSVCHKMFHLLNDLNIHIRRHNGNKPYQCTLCPSNFVEKTALNKHIRNHTGEKPYNCTECKRTFSDRSNLGKHIKMHENSSTDMPNSADLLSITADVNLINRNYTKTVETSLNNLCLNLITNEDNDAILPLEDHKTLQNEDNTNLQRNPINTRTNNATNLLISQKETYVLTSNNNLDTFFAVENPNFYFSS